MEEKKWCVYKHTNKTNGKTYIGITSRTPEQRWKNGAGYICNQCFYNAIQKYGWDNGFTHEIICDKLSESEAKEKEVKYINLYDSMYPNGYNLTLGGEGVSGWKMTEEQREKISIKNKGKKRSAETIEFLRKRQFGKRPDDQTRKKMSMSQTGRKHTDESKQKMSAARKIIGITEQCIAAGNESHKRMVGQYSLDGELLKVWSCPTEAAEVLGLSRHAIYRCANGKSKTSGSYIWKYTQQSVTNATI